MNIWKQKLLSRLYRNEAGEGGESGGSGSASGSESGAQGAQGAQPGSDENKGAGEPPASGDSAKKPTDEEAKLLKEVMDKKNALKKANEKLAELEGKVKEFEGLDITEIRSLLDERKQEETRKLEAKGEWDRLKAQMVEEHKREKQALIDQLESQKGESGKLQSTIAELTLGGAFNSSKFIDEELTLTKSKARVIYGSHFEFAEGKVIAYDKPAGAAERTMLVDGQGEPLSFDAALQKIIDQDPEKDQLLRSKAKQGAGSKTVTPAGKKVAPVGVTGRERMAAALGKVNLFDK